MSQLLPGRYQVFFRFRSTSGKWSAVFQSQFTKTPEDSDLPLITGFQYWSDADFANIITVELDEQPNELNDSILPLDLSSLDDGGHLVSLKFFNNLGQASFTHRSYVKKLPAGFEQNLIVAYRYWFNNDTETLVRTDFPSPLATQETSISLSLNHLNPGDTFLLNFQFLDILGQWSAIHADTVKIYDGTHVNPITSAGNELLLYPNPARHEVFVEWHGLAFNSSVLLTIVDINGRVIQQRKISGPEEIMIQLNVEGFGRGVYFVVFEANESRQSKRLILLE